SGRTPFPQTTAQGAPGRSAGQVGGRPDRRASPSAPEEGGPASGRRVMPIANAYAPASTAARMKPDGIVLGRRSSSGTVSSQAIRPAGTETGMREVIQAGVSLRAVATNSPYGLRPRNRPATDSAKTRTSRLRQPSRT